MLLRKLFLAILLSPIFVVNAQMSVEQIIDLELIKGNYVRVIELTDSCLGYDSTNTLLYKNAIANRKGFNHYQALKQSNLLIKNDSSNVNYLLEHSRNLINLNQIKKAITNLETIFFTLDTLNITAGYTLGRLYKKEDSWGKALIVYKRLAAYQPQNIDFLYNYAKSLTKMKQAKQAIPVLKTILSNNPKHNNS